MKKLMYVLFGVKPNKGTFLTTPPTFRTCKDHTLKEDQWYEQYKVSSLWVDNTAIHNASLIMYQWRQE